MIKIVANVSKKVPVPGIEFSSQSYMAGLEVEVSDGASQEEIRARIRDVYSTLEQAIEAEIQAQSQETPEPAHMPANRLPQSKDGNGGNGNGRKRPATQAQVKAIYAIAKAQGMPRQDLLERVEADYMVTKPEQLTVAQASELIEALKAHQPA